MEILHQLEYIFGGQAQIEISLCWMKMLKAVHITIDNNVAKM